MAKPKKNAPSAAATALGALAAGLETIGQLDGYTLPRTPRKPLLVRAMIDGARRIAVRGQNARALLCLLKAGERGITSRDAFEWAHWFPSYVYDLRKAHRLQIDSIIEPHEGGKHARYILRSRVTIIQIITP
jgi:hypothetical protein